MSNFFDQFDPPAAAPSSGNATLDTEYPFDQFHLAPPPTAANFFDQFDPPSVAPSPGSGTPRAGNFFDQFDAPPAQPAGNFFDQFDAAPTPPVGNFFDQFDEAKTYQSTPKPAAPEITFPERKRAWMEAERARQQKTITDSQLALATLDSRREQRGGYEDQDAADIRKAITLNLKKSQARWKDGQDAIGRGVSITELMNPLNSIARGASSEGPMRGAEGIYHFGLASIGRNKFQTTPTEELRQMVKDADERQLWMKEEYHIDNAHSARPAPRTHIEQLEVTTGLMRDELYYREAKGEAPGHMMKQWLEMTAPEATKLRKQVQEALPVDKAFAESLIGNIFVGIGQLTSIPAYAVPGVGPAMTGGQLYQEGRDDYSDTMRRLGKPVDEDQAHSVALKYVAGAAPMEILTDKLILAKALKPLEGNVTIGQLAKAFGIMALVGGPTEGGEQAWLNTIAKKLEAYDPDRTFTAGVWDSTLAGGAVAGLGGAGAQKIAPREKLADSVKQESMGPQQLASNPPPAPESPNAQARKYNPEEKAEFRSFHMLPPQSPTGKTLEIPSTPAAPESGELTSSEQEQPSQSEEKNFNLDQENAETTALQSPEGFAIEPPISNPTESFAPPDSDVPIVPDPQEAPQNAISTPVKGEEIATAVRPQVNPDGKVVPVFETPESYKYIPVDGENIEWGDITPQISEESALPIQAAPIRVQSGFHDADGAGFGWVHAHDHEKGVLKSGWSNMRDFLADTLSNFDQIWLQPNGRLLLVRTGDTKQVGVVELQPSKGFYGLTTAYPERKSKDLSKKAKLIWERSEPVSTGTGNPGAPSNPPESQSSSNAAVAQGAPDQLQASIQQNRNQGNQKAQGLRVQLAKGSGDAGFIDTAIFAEIVDYGRSLFYQGVRFFDWSRRMVRDLGDKITPHLRPIFRAINGGPWNSRPAIRTGIDARSLRQPAAHAPEKPSGSWRIAVSPRSPALPRNPQPATITRSSAAHSILQQEKNSLLQKLHAADSRSAEGSILRERLGEINTLIDKFNSLPGYPPAPTNRTNGAALAILQHERNSLIQKLAGTDSQSAKGSILRERLGEINAQIEKFNNLPGSTPGHTDRNNRTAFAFLQKERNSLL